MAGHDDKQGTGKHGHKDTQEPWPHREEQKDGSQHSRQSGSEHRSSEAGRSGGEGHSGRQSGGSEDKSLSEREYRDAQGNVHHHPKTYEEQHRKDQKKS